MVGVEGGLGVGGGIGGIGSIVSVVHSQNGSSLYQLLFVPCVSLALLFVSNKWKKKTTINIPKKVK